MYNNHESLHIVQNSVQNIILERILSQINDKIQLKTINKRVPIFGKQKTQKFIPKIIETAAFNSKIHDKTCFLEDDVPKSPMITFQRKFRKSHIGIVSQNYSQNLKDCKSQDNGLQSHIESNRRNIGEKFEQILIKLDVGSEKQDEFIVRKRHNFHRKQIIQKRLQTMTESDKGSNIVSPIDSNYEKQATSVPHSYTTDYNGDLIKFISGNKQHKSALKEQNFHEVKQEESFPKQKSHIKVKITTFVENTHSKPTKIINSGQINNRNIKEIQRESSDYFLLNEQKGHRIFQRKTSSSHDYLSIIKNLELSPGVTLQSTDFFDEDKQNERCGDISACKLIGKLMKKQGKDIADDYPSDTTKRGIKPKKSYQKGPKFAEMQNVYE